MELTSLFIGLLIGAVIGAIILYFILKSSSVPRSSFDDLNQKFIKTNSDLENSTRRITELQQDFTGEKEKNQVQQEVINELKNHLAKFSAEYTSLNSQFQEQREFNSKQSLQIETLNQDRQNVYEKNAELSAINESLKNSLENQKEEITKMQELAKNEFQNLANKILEEKSEKFTEQNQIQLKTILHPLQEKINDFEKKVENTHKESIDYHAALRQQIIGLQDLNKQMSKETLNLTKALKGDNKIQGNWGELVLERVLEKSGLEKGREYEVQKSHSTEQGRLQPDVVINLPDGKKMIIDSKVSLNAYERLINEENEELKPTHLKEHVQSLKRHVEQLSEKNYQSLYHIESPDFVLLFVPIEPAFAIALNEDTHLYNKAFEKNIIIVTPSTLLATLKTIDSMWTNQKQQDNAVEIARQAGALYDKFDGFVTDLLKIGKKMEEAKTEYEGAMNKLVTGKGNLVNSVQKLKIMGAKAKKSLPENLISQASPDHQLELTMEEDEQNLN
ncbi:MULTISPECIES: DNA recombination protein RmuC [unclassified Kaistella]|uniref:DNA recombination protein RmuC n=1 Tax=unclassified Kaistella TaxID=2762626 RepID=UPI00273757A8|nr:MULTISPECIES: DNA recombination protein RmuC [unclassified Kaistella]MDP2454370.1 DNA recombination protein RmuC [Kaistella sp. SH11-4b]MDP2457857.1 DNA recombination protein RmuC [Kaistella sp. SH40-3]MDP2460763.1 DNA recombination protein RmuC [Kaistella sp. SH19-2b]